MVLEIPVIDISNPSKECAKELVQAAATHGFIFIKLQGSGIPIHEIDEMFALVGYNYQTHTIL